MSSTDSRTPDRPERGGGASVLRVAFVVIGLILVLAVVAQLTRSDGREKAPATQGTPAFGTSAPEDWASDGPTGPRDGELPMVRRDATDPMGMGNPQAPVVLVQWTDYRCPYCAVFSREVLPTLLEEYVETGRVRYEVNDVAMFGEESLRAAVAARAAGAQGRYHEFMHAVYEAAPDSGHPELPVDQLVGFAREVGVEDLDRFRADLADPALRDAVVASQQAAAELGVSSVPTFVIGTEPLSGAQPVENFRAFIDAALASAEATAGKG